MTLSEFESIIMILIFFESTILFKFYIKKQRVIYFLKVFSFQHCKKAIKFIFTFVYGL
jgi:hypothetical protein